MNCNEERHRMYFAVLKAGELFSLGDHGDQEAAEATANDQHLDCVIVIDGSTAISWRSSIGWVTGIGGD